MTKTKKHTTMIKNVITLVLILSFGFLNAQEEQKEKKDKPVPEPFAGTVLLDNQTTYINEVKSLEFYIQHKFGTFENGSKDVWGIYAPGANIRLAASFVPYENLQVGYGLTMTDLTHDVNLKYTIVEQTRKNTMPVAIAVSGNVGIGGFESVSYNDDFEFKHRISTFYQLLISRKFSDRITAQLGASHSHFNMADTSKFDYDRIGVHLNGRVKITENMAFAFNYDQPLEIDAFRLESTKDVNILPNIAFGLQIATVTHVFDIYAGYSKEILPQYYMLRTTGDFEMNQFRIGFIIKGLKSF